MRQAHKIVAVVVVVLFVVVGSYGQSLGDVARQQREKQTKDGHATRKIVTNEDIPESPEAVQSTSVSTDEHAGAPAPPPSNDTHSGEEWKAKIQSQRNSVATF